MICYFSVYLLKLLIFADSSYALQLYNSLTVQDACTLSGNVETSLDQGSHSQMVSPESDGNTAKCLYKFTCLIILCILDFQWNDKNTLLLLEEYRTRKEKFRNPKIKKRILWQDIAAVFLKHKYLVNEDILDKKFRNLKQTFMRIRDNQNTKKSTGKGNITWKFYIIMCEIFSIDKTANMEMITIESSLQPYQKAKIGTAESLECPTYNSTPKLEKINYSIFASTTSNSSLTPRKESIQKRIHQVHDKTIEDQDDVMQNTVPTKKSRKGLLLYRQELLKAEKQRVSEISELRKSVDKNNTILQEMVETAKERNRVLARLVDNELK